MLSLPRVHSQQTMIFKGGHARISAPHRARTISSGLEMDPRQFEKGLKACGQLIRKLIRQFPSQLTEDNRGISRLRRLSHEPLPEKPVPLARLLSPDLYPVLQAGLRSNSAGYMGDIPGGGLLHSAYGDLLTSAFNRWPGLYTWAPGLIEIEKTVIRWMCRIMGMPATSAGILTSGGSMANFDAIYLSRFIKFGHSFQKGTLYVSDQAHCSIEKSAQLAGFGPERVRVVRSLENAAFSTGHLEELISRDKKAGLIPFLIIGTAGTTRTGAVDPLPAVSVIACREKCWFHVDAAWAGAFRLTERGKRAMRGIEKADSITIDPHKAFWTPWGSGALLVRRPETLYRAFCVKADYLPFEEADDLMSNPANISGELSRNARGLQLWLPIKTCGIAAFRECLEEKLDLAEWAAEELRKIPGIRITHGPVLGIVTFRIEAPGQSRKRLNKLNKLLLEEVNSDRRIFISGAVIRNTFLIRIAPLHFRTHIEHVRLALELISKASRKILSGKF